MKQLNNFMIMRIGGGVRVSYTFDTIDDITGDLISSNNKGNFVAVDSTLLKDIDDVENYIRVNKLKDE